MVVFGRTLEPWNHQWRIFRQTECARVKPFVTSGVDYAGSFAVALRRARGVKPIKMYVCLFVCFATRAVHLELAHSLSTDSFLAALRRFVSRRGRCSHLYSD